MDRETEAPEIRAEIRQNPGCFASGSYAE